MLQTVARLGRRYGRQRGRGKSWGGSPRARGVHRRWRLWFSAAVLLVFVFVPAAAGAEELTAAPWIGLAANNQSPYDSISAFNARTGVFGTRIATDGDTVAVEPSPDGRTAYADVLYPGDYLDAIDLATGTHTSLPLGAEYVWEAISPDGRTLLLSANGYVLPVDLSGETPAARTRIAIPGGHSYGVAFAPDGGTAYVASGSAVVPIDPAAGTTGTPISTAAGTFGVAVSPDGSTLWIACRESETLTAIALASGTTKEIAVPGHPRNLAVSPDGSRVWVTLESERELTWIDTATDAVGTPVTVSPSGLVAEDVAVTPDGRTLYVTDGRFDGSGQGSEVIKVDVSSGTPVVEGAIPEAQFLDPVWDAITPDQPPTANFTVSSQQAGAATSFDASSSLPGSTPIASYAWSFGDGSTQITTTPTVSHVYAAGGSYDAAVSETDEAGGSTQPVYTGQHLLRAGASSAMASRAVIVAGGPQPAVTLNTTHIGFGTVGLHQAHPARTVTLTNGGQAPLVVGATAIAGAQASQFEIGSDSCHGATVAPGASCSVTVVFAPSGGAAAAQLAINDNASGSPHTVLLSGEGTSVGQIRGTVTRGGGTPLSGVDVSACTSVTRAFCRTAYTSGSGAYEIGGLPAGRYTMEALPQAPGLGAGAASVTLEEGQTVEQTFALAAPRPLSDGISFITGGGSTASGTPVVRWDEPFSFRMPITVPASGPANGIELVTVTGAITLANGSGGNGGFGAAASEHVLVSYDTAGHPADVVGIEDDAGEPMGQAAVAHAARGGIGEFGKAVKEGFDIGKQIADRAKYSRDPEGNEVAEYKQSLPGGASINQTLYKHKNGQSGGFTSIELPSGKGFCEKLPTPIRKPANEVEKGLNDLENKLSKWLQEGEEKAANFLPEQIGKAQEAIKQAPNEWAKNTPNPFTPPTAPYALVALWPGPVFSSGGSVLARTAEAGAVGPLLAASAGLLSAPMTATLLYGGKPYGEGWPASGLPLGARGQTATVQFSMPSLQRTVHGQIDWRVYQSADVVHTSGVVIPASSGDSCEPPEENEGSGYIDPSGRIATRTGIPVAGARVVLLRGASKARLRRVPNGSTLMSPSNRRNPDRTNAAGRFGWDVQPGWYRVTASRRGCRPATAATRVFAVPPPVSDIRLTLRCPRLRRSHTRVSVAARRRVRGMLTMVARVRARGRPDGYVTFRARRRMLGQVAVGPRGVAVLTVAAARVRGRVLATYSGDGYLAPSSGRT
jgi:DNA-binding beta-propeller fold protein YncE